MTYQYRYLTFVFTFFSWIESLFSNFIESAVKPCTNYPGYTDDPLLGCYRIYPPGEPLSHADAEKLCASDGGRLVLINSEAETLAFSEKMKGMYNSFWMYFITYTRKVTQHCLGRLWKFHVFSFISKHPIIKRTH